MTAVAKAAAPSTGAAPSSRPRKPPKRPLKPPRRPPVQYAPLTPLQRVVRSVTTLLAILFFVFVANIALLSQLQHAVSQQQLFAQLKEELADGTAPVSEGDVDGDLLPDGAPVAIIDIPSIGVHEIVVEGTASGAMMSGPGHRRDTVLPGQRGLSVLMGRAAAYGAPFARIQQLEPGSAITVITGQGTQQFSVMGVRYAGDPAPPPIQSGQARLLLETARGPLFIPTGVVYVDAQLTSAAQETGARQTFPVTLPDSARALAGDSSTVWALVFALQFLVVAELLAVWLLGRVGGQKVWIVFFPVMLLGSLWVATQIDLLLPNLL